MHLIVKILVSLLLCLNAFALFASPEALETDNQTNEESNAFIAGVPSPYASKAQSINVVPWNLVKFVCFGHIKKNKCTAEVKMATNTAHPVSLGTVTLELTTGLITPSTLKSNGYTVTVLGAGKTRITKD